jgi:perosamine synthetase
MRNHGRADDGRMEHVRLGFNYRLDELSAALGVAQLDRLDTLLARREAVAAAYEEALAPLQDVLALPPTPPDGATRSWFVYVVRLRGELRGERGPKARDRLRDRLQERGIGCAPYFPAIHLQPYYRERFGFAPGDLPVCERVADRTLALPFFPQMTEGQVERVAEAVQHILASSFS